MTLLHDQEKEQFKKLFAQERVGRPEDHLRVLEAFLSVERHLTAEELAALLEERGVRLPADFVRETLKLLSRWGFARPSRFDNGVVRYEHRHLGDHHDHMVCLKCRRIFEFKDERLEHRQVEVASRHGFHLLRHRMELYGLCAECLRERERCLPLVFAKAGEQLRVCEIGGGTAVRVRLLAMGLRPGDPIEVLTNSGQGQMAISVGGERRLVLGRGLAQKIFVEPA
ncbi:MAG: transcriptional repressor [Desulfobacterales bacterium]